MEDGRARIAVIGCGAWGRNHVATLHSLGRLAAVADEHGQRSFDIAAEFGVPPLAPQQVFEDERIDGVVLALPAHMHAPVAIEALNHGKHVLCEKPIALESAAGREAVEAADRADRILMVGHVLRHHPAFRRLMRLVQEDVLGRVTFIQSHRLGMGRFHATFDAAWDLAPHDLSLVLAIAGEAPIEVAGRGTATLDVRRDNALIYLRFPSGATAHIAVSRLNPYRDRRLTVVGTKAMAVFDDLEDWPRKLAIYRHDIRPREGGGFDFDMDEPDYVAVEPAMPLTEELLNFAGSIEGTTRPLTPGSEGVEVVRILERVAPLEPDEA